jgi:AcrR family transcriptional regulator
MSATKEDILGTALRLLNEGGLGAVSLRAVAEELGLSPGNVSYHFRRKEDLLAALTERLREGNAGRLEQPVTSLGDFFELFNALFQNQYRYRGLVLALPELVQTFEPLRNTYRKTEAARRRAMFGLLTALRRAGVLGGSDDELNRVVSHLTLIARFWIAEGRVSYGRHGEQRIIAHYLALIADNLVPLVARAHRDVLETYRNGWIDPNE